METIILTPRLKLTLITTAERKSPELQWLHELRSNEQTTWWSIHGRSKTLEDTEKVIKGILPHPTTENKAKSHRVVYAVHELVPPPSSSPVPTPTPEAHPTRMIGLITLRSLDSSNLPLPPHLFPASTQPPSSILTVELGYQYLPAAWGKGYATESVSAVFAACQRATPAFWAPFEKIYVRAIVNAENAASQRVVAKVGMALLGVYGWEGEAVFLAGKWRETGDLCVYGRFLV